MLVMVESMRSRTSAMITMARMARSCGVRRVGSAMASPTGAGPHLRRFDGRWLRHREACACEWTSAVGTGVAAIPASITPTCHSKRCRGVPDTRDSPNAVIIG